MTPYCLFRQGSKEKSFGTGGFLAPEVNDKVRAIEIRKAQTSSHLVPMNFALSKVANEEGRKMEKKIFHLQLKTNAVLPNMSIILSLPSSQRALSQNHRITE